VNTNPKFSNALIHASSPYLLQHAHNPVNWEEWSTGIWQKAAEHDKLVLLSIGYSACHWCHVMEKESFEDEQTADLMNRWFINVKIDREERPDVDMVYMDACQLMTGRGGWPLNVFCLPDGRPVYAGTYFPIEKWQQVLIQLNTLWSTDRDKALEYAGKLMGGLSGMNEQAAPGVFGKADIHPLYEKLAEQFDWNDGGPDRAPKFPMPNNYELLLDFYLISGNEEARDFVNLTLLKMGNGGINDQLRGGFCRYSTDKHWFAPHFEKMLYDNAQLISLYSRAYAITDAPFYKEIAESTIQFCKNELFSNHGYFSALDADSEGVEGRFYTFTRAELEQILNEEELRFAETVFSFTPEGNWEHGYNILHRHLAPLQVLQQLNLDVSSYTAMLKTVKAKMLDWQNKRPRPGLDHKIITCWNGLMLKALADAGIYLNRPDLIHEAEMLADTLWKNMWTGTHLHRIFNGTSASIPAFLEDYACLAEGLLSLYTGNGKEKYAKKALLLVEASIKLFRDGETGIFYFTPIDGDALFTRKTDLSDDVINSSVSVIASLLLKLGVLFGRPAMGAMGEDLLSRSKQYISQYPAWYSNWSRLSLGNCSGLLQVECCGPDAAKNAHKLMKKMPSSALICFTENTDEIPLFAGKSNAENKIYICLGQTCLEPVEQCEQALEICEDLITLQ